MARRRMARRLLPLGRRRAPAAGAGIQHLGAYPRFDPRPTVCSVNLRGQKSPDQEFRLYDGLGPDSPAVIDWRAELGRGPPERGGYPNLCAARRPGLPPAGMEKPITANPPSGLFRESATGRADQRQASSRVRSRSSCVLDDVPGETSSAGSFGCEPSPLIPNQGFHRRGQVDRKSRTDVPVGESQTFRVMGLQVDEKHRHRQGERTTTRSMIRDHDP